MWKLSYSAPKGCRINHGWCHVTVYGLWFSKTQQKWVKDLDGGYCSNCDSKPKSIKAFTRYLNKHPELRGYKVVFANRHYDSRGFDFDIEAVWENE